MSLGENVKRLREAANINQLELSEKVGVSQSMICQIERGTKTMTVQLAKEVADALGCRIDDLLANDPPNKTA